MLELKSAQVLLSDGLALTPKLSVDLCPGTVVGLIGPNGCGKSLLTRAVLGVLLPRHQFTVTGRVTVEPGLDIGYVPQQTGLLAWRRVESNILLPARFHRQNGTLDLGRLYAAFNLAPRKDDLPHQLSGGYQVRTAICRALATKPGLLVLDEPTRELDEMARSALITELRAARERGAGVWVVSHEIPFVVAVADFCVILSSPQAVPKVISKGEQRWTDEGLSTIVIGTLMEERVTDTPAAGSHVE